MKYLKIAIIKKVMLGTFICLFVISCKHNEKKYHNVMEKIEGESVNYKAPSVSSSMINAEIKTVLVEEGETAFLIPERKSQISSYNCVECHTEPLRVLKQKQADKKAAHWDIKLNHANPETMNCTTCHTSNDMGNLHSLTSSTIDFNYSHKLCSQCHQKEFKDWKGGAHGKQLGGWSPPRLSNTCVNCHNPHTPQFEKRWPARFNTEKVKERQ